MRKTLFLIFSLLSAISFMLIFPAAVFSVVPGALSRYEVSGIPFRQLLDMLYFDRQLKKPYLTNQKEV
jgi:hypothetical protein